MPPRKVLTLAEAIAEHVPDGASVALGMALESLIPFAAGHELIRHGRRELELIGPISDMLFDQLIGAGCVRRVTAAWVGNVSAGLGHNYRRAVSSSRSTRTSQSAWGCWRRRWACRISPRIPSSAQTSPASTRACGARPM